MIKKHIPNAITSGNLLCGCLAIVKIFEGNLVWAAYLVGIALILDFFDGFAARMLKVSSAIGKDLDSLADMVTFGVVPGLIMFKIIDTSRIVNMTAGMDIPGMGGVANDNAIYWPAYFAFIIPIFSAIRLAKFNNDTRQSDSFIGLPTPANAMFICSLPLIFNINQSFLSNEHIFNIGKIVLQPYVLCSLSLVLSLLLVSELPLIALKFKNLGWTDNKLRFIFLGLSVTLLIFFQYFGIPLVIILYILLSIVDNIFLKNKV
ncbi:MAG: CDP-alcohol phosphatidyltransferase family protein [Bacteroidota bacterium]|nr:CDP-alcohol phosphatidyltransferase family protein [Bacteroidota bacterium]MDP3145072.1 CDP-alcohol phosphatidyltransferase family protein [Bacteroidota bacterium]